MGGPSYSLWAWHGGRAHQREERLVASLPRCLGRRPSRPPGGLDEEIGARISAMRRPGRRDKAWAGGSSTGGPNGTGGGVGRRPVARVLRRLRCNLAWAPTPSSSPFRLLFFWQRPAPRTHAARVLPWRPTPGPAVPGCLGPVGPGGRQLKGQPRAGGRHSGLGAQQARPGHLPGDATVPAVAPR